MEVLYETYNKTYDTIPKYLPLKVNLNHIDGRAFTHIFDFIEIPDNVSKKLKYLYKIDFTRFVPKHIDIQETFFSKLVSVMLGYSGNSHARLEDIAFIQTKLLKEFISFSNHFTILDTPRYHDNNNVMVDIHNNMILVNNNFVLLLINDIIVICKNNDIIMFSSNINYFESTDSTLIFKIFLNDPRDKENMIVNTVMNSPHKKIQYMTYNINNIGDLTTTYYYEKYETNLKIVSHTLEKSNGDIKEKMVKNGMYIEHNYNKNKDISKLISQCMYQDNIGLHYRGKYEEIKSKDTLNKTLTRDDTIIYNKENNNVLIDTINEIELKEDIIIGWKAAKSVNNEIRIIKLAIPMDAKKIRPIDKEYFYTKGKERCNKAIVMDIQLPMEEEISLVPSEMSAYSYIFNENGRFVYTIGKEVVPDTFDEDENESCTHGIHFYRNRQSVFDVYVN